MKTAQELIDATAHIVALIPYLPRSQRHALRDYALRGEEAPHFREVIARLVETIRTMPRTYDTDGQGRNAVAALHYFRGGCDWWIIELDRGAPDDTPEQLNSQCFGVADLGYGPEAGYISLPEIIAAGAELDLYYTPATVSQIMERSAA